MVLKWAVATRTSQLQSPEEGSSGRRTTKRLVKTGSLLPLNIVMSAVMLYLLSEENQCVGRRGTMGAPVEQEGWMGNGFGSDSSASQEGHMSFLHKVPYNFENSPCLTGKYNHLKVFFFVCLFLMPGNLSLSFKAELRLHFAFTPSHLCPLPEVSWDCPCTFELSWFCLWFS